jgi:hypothetical protein
MIEGWQDSGAVWQYDCGSPVARNPTPIDAYLATVKSERRAALDKLL